jgi:hypothetical protein
VLLAASSGYVEIVPTREERRAENEAIFRAGNERIVHNRGTSSTDDASSTLPLICECGSADCMDTIELTRAEYEAVRQNKAHFAIEPGHQDEDEVVVDEFDRYAIVEKTGRGLSVVD